MSSTAASGLTWSLRDRSPAEIPILADGPGLSPQWAWGGSTGRGIRVCVVDSGIERDHPLVGQVDGSYLVLRDPDGTITVEPTETGDTCGHGTACAGIIRRTAPDCELYSVRVLGQRFSGTGDVLLAGLRWAVEQRFDVINLSLSTTRPQFTDALRAIADEAAFARTVIVASAHNTPVESFPWRFSSVISVGSHQEEDAGLYLYNPSPPVEFFAQGQNVTVPGWAARPSAPPATASPPRTSPGSAPGSSPSIPRSPRSSSRTSSTWPPPTSRSATGTVTEVANEVANESAPAPHPRRHPMTENRTVTQVDPVARELLQSVVDTARAIFGAQASSIFLLETGADELVFQAVSGQGQESLVGRRFPAGRGVAGWVASSGEPMVVDDLSSNGNFARDLAESTGYVPDSLMAAPLLHSSGVLGVLEVLDPTPQARSDLGELELLALFARQAATALRVVLDRRAGQGAEPPPPCSHCGASTRSGAPPPAGAGRRPRTAAHRRALTTPPRPAALN